jgi:hypothetical protein
MKKYEASQGLVDILLNFGFQEDTHVNYPEHSKRLNNGPYNPHGMKRHFRFPGTKETIYFDYINMRLPTNIDLYSVTEDELKSILTYVSLSSADRRGLENDRYNALSIPEIITRMKATPRLYSTALNKRIKDKFDAVEL